MTIAGGGGCCHRGGSAKALLTPHMFLVGVTKKHLKSPLFRSCFRVLFHFLDVKQGNELCEGLHGKAMISTRLD